MLQITGKQSHHSPLLPGGARTMQMEIILVSGAGVTISSIVNTTTTTEMVTWIPVQDTGVASLSQSTSRIEMTSPPPTGLLNPEGRL